MTSINLLMQRLPFRCISWTVKFGMLFFQLFLEEFLDLSADLERYFVAYLISEPFIPMTIEHNSLAKSFFVCTVGDFTYKLSCGTGICPFADTDFRYAPLSFQFIARSIQ